MGIEKTDNNDDQLSLSKILQNKTVEQSQDDASVSPQTLKKGQVAMYAELNELAEGALKNSTTALPTNQGAKTTTASSNNDSASNAAPSTTNSSQNVWVDPLAAAIYAAASVNISDSEFTEQVANMQEKLATLSTDVTKAGQTWTQDFYSYGVSGDDNGSMGQYQLTTGITEHTPGDLTSVSVTIDNGMIAMSIDGGKNYTFVGFTQSTGYNTTQLPTNENIGAAFPGYTLTGLSSTQLAAVQTAFDNNLGFGYDGPGTSSPFTVDIVNNNSTGYVTQGTGLAGADSTDVSPMNSQLQYINSTVSSWTTAAQTNEGLPANSISATTNAINTAESNLSSITGVLSSVAQLLQGF